MTSVFSDALAGVTASGADARAAANTKIIVRMQFSLFYSILGNEWPAVKTRLASKLYG